jgi:MFS family permease
VVYLFAPTWWIFLPGMVLTTAGASFGFMGALALTGDAVGARRRATAMAVQNIIGRLPPGLMPPLGGLLIGWLGLLRGVRVGLLATLLLSGAAIWLQCRHFRMLVPPERSASIDLLAAWRGMCPDLRRTLVADCLVRFGAGMSTSFVVLYVVDVLHGSALDYGLLTTAQTVTSALVYLPVALLADRAGRSGRWPFVAATYVMFAAFPALLALLPSAAWLIPAFIVAGLRELGEPVRKALIVDLAEGDSRGSTIGAYFMTVGMVTFPASFLGGWLWETSPALPFVVGAGVTTLGLLWFLWRGPR